MYFTCLKSIKKCAGGGKENNHIKLKRIGVILYDKVAVIFLQIALLPGGGMVS